ncbi:MAG TPA: Ig-like domain repeat protein [Fimbriiglobus sp.]
MRTYDSREAIVDFDINTSLPLTQPFDIQIFRSDQPTYSASDRNNVAVGLPYHVTDLSPGHHTTDIPPIDLSTRAPNEPASPVEPLAPDPKLPYVLAVADPDRKLPASITIDETQAHFKIFVIADVTQGFGPTKAQWVQDMVDQLKAAGYASVEPLYWHSFLPESGQTVLGGNNLYQQILPQAISLPAVLNDVIDVQLIGHSRGTAVVSQAMQDLVDQLSSAEPQALLHGYYEMTLLDPHPANLTTTSDISVNTSILNPYLTISAGYALASAAYDDPPIVVADRVNQVDVFYEQNTVSTISPKYFIKNPLEASFNLLGDPTQIMIKNPAKTIRHEYNLTSLGLGHSEVWQWYMDYVINNAVSHVNPQQGALANGFPPPWPDSSGGSSPPPGGLNLKQLLFPSIILVEGLADDVVNYFTAASDDLAQGNAAQSISDLAASDAAIKAAPDSDFVPFGQVPLLGTNQNMIDTLGPGPSTEAGTIYWTGDAGLDAVGNYANWDEAGNWSTVNPLVNNVRQDILPGPLNDVVVNLPNAKIYHLDDAYDTISSLTAVDGVYIGIANGTLDLSGSGTPGTFQVPGIIDFSKSLYGNCQLDNGVLANAIVTDDTAILVFGASKIDGGVLYGTISDSEDNIQRGGATLNLAGSWVNMGSITLGDSVLILGDNLNVGSEDSSASSHAWINNGTISTNNTSVALGGWLSYDPSAKNLATLDLSTDSVYLSGILDNADRTLAFSPGVTSSTGSWYLNGGRINGGTLSGAPLRVSNGTLDGVENDGVIDVTGTVTFDGSWTNTGTITIDNGSTANLGGSFGTDTYNGLRVEAGATVNLTGILFNIAANNPISGGILALNSSTGPLYLEGGVIFQGAITTTDNNVLVATPGGGTLDGVTLDGVLDLTQFAGTFDLTRFMGSNVSIFGGLTLNGTIELGGAAGTSNAGGINFGYPEDNFAQTVSGSGTIQFGQDDAGDLLLNSSFEPLTIGPNITVMGGLHSYIKAPNAAIVNQGTIKNSTGGSLTMPVNLINAGTLDAGTGALTATNYTQTASGILAIGIGGASQFGHLAVEGKVTLSGTLKVSLVNGYIPSNGDSFQILTFSQLFGDFAAMDGLDDAGGINQFGPAYSNTDLTLSVGNNGNAPNPTIYWTGDAGDNNWDNPGNWSYVDPLVNNVPQTALPRPVDNVVIDLPLQTINHSAPIYETISNLTVTGQDVTLNLSAGTLDFSGGGGQGTLQADQSGDTVNLGGTDLKSVIITSGTTVTATSSGSVLDSVQLDGILDMTQYDGAYAQVVNTVTVNGAIELGGVSNSASLFFGYQNDSVGMTVAGTGTIQFGQGSMNDNIYNLSEGTLTFATSLTIVGGMNSYFLSYYPISGPIDNQGTIDESTNNGQLTIDMSSWVNDGSILVSNGATATLEGQSWSNSSTGKIAVTNATLNLSGSWTNYGTITVDPSTINLGSPDTVLPSDPASSLYYWSNQGTLSIDSGSTVTLAGIVTTDTVESLAASGLLDPNTSLNVTGVLDNSVADNPITGGVLALGSLTGPMYLLGGTIYQGTITTDGNYDLVATVSGGTLDGVQLDGSLDMTQFQGSSADIINGLTLNGAIELGGASGTSNYADLYFGIAGDNIAQTIAGTGTIQVGPAEYKQNNKTFDPTLYNRSNDTLSFGSKIIIQGSSAGGFDISSFDANSGAIDNQGTIEDKGHLTIDAGLWVNDGAIIIGNGSPLYLYGSWTNNGTITGSASTDGPGYVVLGSPTNLAPTDLSAADYFWSSPGTISIADGTIINLGGVFTTDTFDGLLTDLQTNGQSLANDTVNLTGSLDNSAADNPQSGGALALNASTGPLYLFAGRIYQGIITTSGSNNLVSTGQDGPLGTGLVGTLDGVTLDGTLDMTRYLGSYADIINGMTLNGTIELGGTIDLGGTSNSGILYFGGGLFRGVGDNMSQTVSGTGSIEFGRSFDSLISYSSGTLTFGPNITIHGGGDVAIRVPYGAIDNQGTISVDNSGGQLTISSVGWINDGSIRVSNGASATLQGQRGNPASIYLFTVAPWTNNGTITAAAGTTLNLYGGWTNNGTITVDSLTVGLGSPINIDPTSAAAANYLWTNKGTLTIADGATVNLGGIVTTDQFDVSFANVGVTADFPKDSVNLTGSMDNSAADNAVSGGVLALNASTGPLYLAGGRIHQGVISTSGAHDLVATVYASPGAVQLSPNNYGTLDGVTLDGTLDMTQFLESGAEVINGLTLNGTILLGGASQDNISTGQDAFLSFGIENDNVVQMVDGVGTIQFGQDFAGDTLLNESNQTLTFGPDITIQGGLNSFIYANFSSFGSHGSIDLQGTIEENTSGGTLNTSSASAVGYGSTTTSFTNWLGGTLTGGTWEVSNGGRFIFGNDYLVTITTNSASIIMRGANSAFENVGGSNDALAGFTTNTSLGSFSVADGYNFTASGDFSNAGVVTVGNGSTITVPGSYTQSSTGSLDIVLGGINPFGRLLISGNAALGGALSVSLQSGYTPRLGDSFTVLTFASRSGDFTTMNGLDLGNGNFFTPVYDSGHLTLVVTNPHLSASIVTVNSTASVSTYGQSVAFTAAVTAAGSATNSPTGFVQLLIDGSNFSNPVPISGGSASFVTSTLSVGNHSVVVVYSGDNNFVGSNGTLNGGQTVLPAPTTPSPTLVGYQQFAVGAGSGGPSTVTEYNPDRSVVATFNPFPGATGGVRTAVADFNGDGTADIAFGTGPGVIAEVKILDGKTGAVLFDVQPFDDFTGGVFVAAGFILGNGMADLVITPDVTGGPRVEVYEGGDFKEFANFFGIDDPNFRGGARAAVGDLNGDGHSDLVISAGFTGGPRISVYDGAALLQRRLVHPVADFFAFESTLRNGVYLAVGDTNGDGLSDLIFGAGPGGGPRVLIISGQTLLTQGAIAAIDTPIANFFGGDGNNRGGIRVAVKNLDGDGYADVLTGSGQTGGSEIATYLGKNLTVDSAIEDSKFDSIPGFTGGVFVG